jgi:outer membrane protein assembly factor BamA
MKGLAMRAALTALLAALPCRGLADEPPRVGHITIRALNVFSPEEATRGWLYRAANALHIETRESVIRKFLLFREGEPFDPTRLEETERNLRVLPFLKAASVLPGPPHDGVVDVMVTTQDAWTTQPGISLGKKGGVTTYSFSFEEKDLLGTGRSATVSYGKDPDRIDRLVEYKDPYLLGPYWNSDFLYSANSDGTEEAVRIGRPFYSFVSPWATDFLLTHLSQNDRIFENGEESSLFRQSHREFHFRYGRALTASDTRARRLSVGFELLKDEFNHVSDRPNDLLPDDRSFRYVSMRYEDVSNDFIKLNYVNRDSRFEDFNLGRSFSVIAAVSPSLFGLDRTTEFLQVQGDEGWSLSPWSFLQAHLEFGTRLVGGVQNAILSTSVNFVRKFDTSLLQTLVSRLQYDQGWNLDRDVQFFADGANGLRGYRLHSFEGNKRIIWNLEHRLFSGREVLQLASFGAAVFFDTGTAIPEGRPMKLSEFKSDVGVGLRIAISRASTNSILRIDVAYPLNPDPFGRKGWLVSFSSGQVF